MESSGAINAPIYLSLNRSSTPTLHLNNIPQNIKLLIKHTDKASNISLNDAVLFRFEGFFVFSLC